MTAESLVGRRILVTRAQEDAEQWAERLLSLGAVPVVYPCLVAEVLDDAPTAEALRHSLADAHWLVVTSRRGAAAVVELLGGRPAPSIRIAAVGLATARACMELLGRANFISVVTTSAGLGTSLGDHLTEGGASPAVRVVVAGAVDGRGDAEEALAARGVMVTRVSIYRTVPRPVVTRRLDLTSMRIDTVLLASPSALTGLMNSATVPGDARVITIGPTTTAAAIAAGLRVTAEARVPTFDSMIEALT